MSKFKFKKSIIRLIKNLSLFLVLFIVLAQVMDFFRGKEIAKDHIPQEIFIDTQKSEINLTELSKDQLTIVYFWATWCTPCKVTTPSIKQLSHDYPVVAVAMASGKNKDIQNYFDADSNILLINDDNQNISNIWGVPVTPTILFIKDSKVVHFTTGISAYPSLKLRAWWLNR